MSVQMWRYAFPNEYGSGFGWAIFFLDDAGCFTALSDYGDWSHRWPMAGMPKGMGLREFLLGCDDDYVLRKIAPTREYDEDGTEKAIKEMILGMRREKQLDAEEAREEWDNFLHHRPLESDYEFWKWSEESKLPERHELYQVKYSEQAKAFLKECMPLLKAAIKNDLGL